MDLEIRNIRKTYGRKAVLVDQSRCFADGLTILTGPSGAGKSTLLRLLATAERPDAGIILWRDTPLPRARRTLRRALGYAPQAVDLPDDLTAREFVAHMAALKGLERRAADAQFLHIAARLGLEADVETRIAGWSGGMRRRLVFAQALLGAPALLILDEPTAELDRDSAGRVEALIIEHARNATVVMTTHQPDALRDDATDIVRIGTEA